MKTRLQRARQARTLLEPAIHLSTDKPVPSPSNAPPGSDATAKTVIKGQGTSDTSLSADPLARIIHTLGICE
jgi:hypothetical protein